MPSLPPRACLHVYRARGYNVVVVLTLTHRHNAVRGSRTGSNNSRVEDHLRRKHKTRKYTQKLKHVLPTVEWIRPFTVVSCVWGLVGWGSTVQRDI